MVIEAELVAVCYKGILVLLDSSDFKPLLVTIFINVWSGLFARWRPVQLFRGDSGLVKASRKAMATHASTGSMAFSKVIRG